MTHPQENNMSLISRVIHLKDSHGNKNSYVHLTTQILVLKRVKGVCVSKILMRGQRS